MPLPSHAPRRHVRLPLCRHDDAGVGVVKPVLGQPHERGVLLDQQDEQGVGPDLRHAVHVGRDGFPAHAHAAAVDLVPVLAKSEAADHHALFRRDDVQGGARAAEHAAQVVEHGVRLRLVLEELDVGVEEVALGDVDALGAQLVDQAQNARGDRGFPARRRAGKGPARDGAAQDDAVELADVELVALRARGDVQGEALAAEDGLGEAVDEGLDLGGGGLGVGVFEGGRPSQGGQRQGGRAEPGEAGNKNAPRRGRRRRPCRRPRARRAAG